MTDQYSFWRHALAGNICETEKGNPRSGYWRSQAGTSALAIWRDGDSLFCEAIGMRQPRTPDEIDEAFGWLSRYPIPFELFDGLREGKELPPEYKTRLSLDEIKRNVAWTRELGLAKIGADTMPAENPRAIMGDNNPPEEMTPDRKLAFDIDGTAAATKAWLDGIGGKPVTKADADLVANYATRFGEFSASAKTQHEIEKRPILEAGRTVDTKWFGLRDKADLLRKRCLALGNEWIDAENARRAEEARKASEAAQEAARKQAAISDAPVQEVAPIEPERVTIGTAKTVSQRMRRIWTVADLPSFMAYLAAMQPPPPDLIAVAEKLAQRLGSAGVNAPGIREETKRSAA